MDRSWASAQRPSARAASLARPAARRSDGRLLVAALEWVVLGRHQRRAVREDTFPGNVVDLQADTLGDRDEPAPITPASLPGPSRQSR